MRVCIHVFVFMCVYLCVRLDTGLAPGRKRAYLLYKAALKEAIVAEEDSKEMGIEKAAPSHSAPTHPYMLALGVLAIQKVSCYRLRQISSAIYLTAVKSQKFKYLCRAVYCCVFQYLSEECSIESLKEFKDALEQRDKVRGQLIKDLKKKRKLFMIYPHFPRNLTYSIFGVPLALSVVLSIAELQFRENLVKGETEMEGLRRTVADLKHQIKIKDKSSSDNKKLRDIVAAQDEKVFNHAFSLHDCSLSFLQVLL